MNKHIKEIASLYFEERNGFIVSPVDGYTVIEDELQRFAELIISECMEAVIESDPSEKMTLSEPYLTIIENIKDRLGWHDE